MKARVAFQGELEAYSEAAIAQHFGSVYEPIPCNTFCDVLERVRDGTADYGCLPIENSTTGAIRESQELLGEFSEKVSICGEVRLRIRHCLLGVPGGSLEKIRIVYSHPQALAQCHKFLEDFKVTAESFYDTAGAARFIAQQGDPALAAIASRQAAARYGLIILRAGIESNPHNTTRFLVLRALRPQSFPIEG
jgi:prephenate dehydratase